jgi:hypothetical protein
MSLNTENPFYFRTIGKIHLSGIIIRNIYGFVVPDLHELDTLYLMWYYILPVSWLLFRGECVVSYIAKKIKDPSYQLGSEANNNSDIADLFPNHLSYRIFSVVSTAAYFTSVQIVFNRTYRDIDDAFYNTILSSEYRFFYHECAVYLYLVYILDKGWFNEFVTRNLYPAYDIVLGSVLLLNFMFLVM